MAKYSNREMRQQVLDERGAKNKILTQVEELKKELGATSGALEYSRAKNESLLKLLETIKSSRWYRLGVFFLSWFTKFRGMLRMIVPKRGYKGMLKRKQ